MRKQRIFAALGFGFAWGVASLNASPDLMEQHCSQCHNDDDLKGDFSLTNLGAGPSDENIFWWEDSLDFVVTGEMPPADESNLSDPERERLVEFLTDSVRQFHVDQPVSFAVPPRRLNNRELANSVRDVLLIDHVGTHQPTNNLLGDTLFDGFDTHGDSLGMSQFHLEQYITSLRAIIDGVILEGAQPSAQHYEFPAERLLFSGNRGNSRWAEMHRTPESIDFLDMRNRVYLEGFETVPTTGRYRVKIRASGIDREIYAEAMTGLYHADPIQIRIHLGDRTLDFDLPDDEILEIKLDEWLVAGTRLEISYPIDGLRERANGNFKFQFAIAHDYLREHDPELHAQVIRDEVPQATFRSDQPSHWVHWIKYWQGPRPRIFDAAVEGPFYEDWPNRDQQRLLGPSPSLDQAEEILLPIARRAWRREITPAELQPIISMMRSLEPTIGPLGAFKEGLVALMVSPSFLLVNPPQVEATGRFATKLNLFLQSTIPPAPLPAVAMTAPMTDFDAIRDTIAQQIQSGEAAPFLQEFPYAWLQLDRINFMAPDPDHFPLYNRKNISEDMINEAVTFFRHVATHNLPLTEFISADYSFINADLAKIYGVTDVPADSQLRRYEFTDGRRGGILGMGAFLTLTADSLGTSPIHRAIYVMENLMGIHPSPPPADVEITEPDVRQAKTIKEILAAHTADETCASCHRSIDPFGYAFENFDPQGSWRETYTMQIAPRPAAEELKRIAAEDQRLAALGLPPVPKPWENPPITVDSSGTFRDGSSYQNIIEYRELMRSPKNQKRFVRCFITKLLTYANGVEPHNYWAIEQIVETSAAHNFRIIETIAAVVDSPLFREESKTAPMRAHRPELAELTRN